MEFVISYNKRMPKAEHIPPDGRTKYGFREQCMRILRGEVKNVVYTVPKSCVDHAERILSAARSYVRKNGLPLSVFKRRNHVFICPMPTTMEKKKAQA